MGNIDKFIFVNKNWPFDSQFNCMKPTNFAFACDVIQFDGNASS